jgi:Ca-activated chloride channel family protein
VPARGTAIGDALALSLAVLRRSEARSKVVVLLSDGDSNWTTEFSPDEARDLAVEMGVRVFTILLGQDPERSGRRSSNRYPVDPALLRGIAEATGGLFFSVADEARLAQSFERVRQTLELTRHRVRAEVVDSDLYSVALWPALLLLLLELLMRATRWRRFP